MLYSCIWLSIAATVLAIIKRSRKGVDVATLKNKTGFEGRKISGIVQRFKREGKTKTSMKFKLLKVKYDARILASERVGKTHNIWKSALN